MKPSQLASRVPQPTGDAQRDIAALTTALHDILRSMEDLAPLSMTGGNVLVGNRQLGTDATRGFLYMPRFQGEPTGTPTDYNAGSPYGFDELNDVFYVYDFDAEAWIAIGDVDDSTEAELWLRILLKLENIEASL